MSSCQSVQASAYALLTVWLALSALAKHAAFATVTAAIPQHVQEQMSTSSGVYLMTRSNPDAFRLLSKCLRQVVSISWPEATQMLSACFWHHITLFVSSLIIARIQMRRNTFWICHQLWLNGCYQDSSDLFACRLARLVLEPSPVPSKACMLFNSVCPLIGCWDISHSFGRVSAPHNLSASMCSPTIPWSPSVCLGLAGLKTDLWALWCSFCLLWWPDGLFVPCNWFCLQYASQLAYYSKCAGQLLSFS